MIIIGEKINGSIPAVADAIARRDAEFIKARAIAQEEAGATFIDCCASVPEEVEVETLKWMIECIEDATDLPIAVDSPSADVLAQAYKFCSRPGLINSVSGEGDKIDKIMAKAKEYGIAPSRIHIDPLVEMLCTSENGIETNIEVISTVRERYPSIHITAAVSNISFNLPVRKMINLGFTVLAMNAGLDSAILDPTNRDMMGVIFATEALLGLDDYCMEYIGAYREGLFGPVKS